MTIGEMIGWAAEKVPGVRGEVVDDAHADVRQDSPSRGGMWGAYDISRVTAETGWRPRPMRDAFHAYMDWIVREELNR